MTTVLTYNSSLITEDGDVCCIRRGRTDSAVRVTHSNLQHISISYMRYARLSTLMRSHNCITTVRRAKYD